MKLEITKEKVLEAASKCSTAKETLKTLFPEVFEEDKYSIKTLAKETRSGKTFSEKGQYGALVNESLLYNDAFFLTAKFRWSIEERGDKQYLIPTKK